MAGWRRWCARGVVAIVDTALLTVHRVALAKVLAWSHDGTLSGLPVLLYLWCFPQVLVCIGTFLQHMLYSRNTGMKVLSPVLSLVCLSFTKTHCAQSHPTTTDHVEQHG